MDTDKYYFDFQVCVDFLSAFIRDRLFLSTFILKLFFLHHSSEGVDGEVDK